MYLILVWRVAALLEVKFNAPPTCVLVVYKMIFFHGSARDRFKALVASFVGQLNPQPTRVSELWRNQNGSGCCRASGRLPRNKCTFTKHRSALRMLDERQLISGETIANTHQLKSWLRRVWGRGLEIGHPV